MRKSMLAIVVSLAFLPSLAQADPNAAGGAATGAAVGAGTGFLIGGPVGAAVGAGVGGVVGAGASRPQPDTVVIDRQAPVSERSCVRDSSGNQVCKEIRR